MLQVLDWPVAHALAFFSALKLHLHENVDVLPQRWVNYIDIQLFAGYPAMEDREMTDNPVQWLSRDVATAYSQQWWESKFSSTFGRAMRTTSNGFLSYKSFVLSRWLWSTGGASRQSHALLDGSPVRTKFGAAISLSDS